MSQNSNPRLQVTGNGAWLFQVSAKPIPLALRQLVTTRAQGLCEYCLTHEDDTYLEIEMEKLDRIQINPKVCLGQPVIRGTRITVSVILKMLASGKSVQDVIEAYPELEVDDVQQTMKYAAWVVSDQLLVTPTT